MCIRDSSTLDARVREQSLHLQPALGVAAQNATRARRFQNHARAAGLVVDGQHLRGMWKDVAHLALSLIHI